MTETRDLLSEKLQRRKASDMGDDKVARCNLALLAQVDLALPLVLVARELIVNPDGLAEAGGGELLRRAVLLVTHSSPRSIGMGPNLDQSILNIGLLTHAPVVPRLVTITFLTLAGSFEPPTRRFERQDDHIATGGRTRSAARVRTLSAGMATVVAAVAGRLRRR